MSTSLQNDEYYFNYFAKARKTQKHYEFFFFFFEVLKKYVTLKESLVQIQLFRDN